MAKRKTLSRRTSKALFRHTANRTNTKNVVSHGQMMRGGFHF